MNDIKTTLKEISESSIEILCEVSAESFEKERPIALKKVGEEISLPGFRKGHVPENMIAQKFGDAFILEEMANLAMDRAYSEILTRHKIHAIAMPEVKVTKLAKGNPFEFTLTFQVMPEIKLPDYKKIAKEVMSGDESADSRLGRELIVTDEEVEQALNELRKQFATKDAEGKEVLPEVTDELAQKFGPFANVEEFKTKIKESIAHEKTTRAREKKRMQTMEKIAEGITAKLPQALIDGELERMVGQFKHDVEQMGMKFEDYLATTKKTIEEMRKEWTADAEKRAKVQIALNEISLLEKIEVLKEDLDRESKFFMEKYTDAEPARVRMHLEMMLVNEKVFQFLESQK
ncbi:MAG: Trigger factor [Candidatus Nomurabacteria bacterium GW2011_GWD1_44_10]|nr:MAG: Trigger factor [Candidatus Nomurabacteria bacterium GW2011_GWD1_44_10]